MKYIRTEQCGNYKRITTVTDACRYEQIAIWPDGLITSSFSDTIQNMGWPSVREFLKARPGFTKED